jgi:hypothetical protein
MPSRDSSARSDQLGFPDIFRSGYDEFLERSVGRTKASGAQKRPTSRNYYNEKKEREKAERSEKVRIENSKLKS